MLFSSLEFLFLFLPVIFAIYALLGRYTSAVYSKTWLVFSSLFFYGWWEWKYLILIIGSMVVNFTLSQFLIRGERLKLVLWAGLAFNFGLLGYFKYFDFFVGEIVLRFGGDFEPLGLVLPLAISFFTFQQVSYLVDCSKGKVNASSDFLSYSLFVTFFPQLIAGPIVHHSEMMPQFASRERNRLTQRNIFLGLTLFSIGLFKKLFIADQFSVWVGLGYQNSSSLTFFDAWITSLSYTFQLYYDFSGYSDMAIGLAFMFNILLPLNFNSPYKAINIQDFWRRWHMTLSRWLRDYIYIPLGGSKSGRARMFGAIFLTFLLGGIWHGAGWNFIIWGVLHGLALIVYQLWVLSRLRLHRYLSWFLLFNFINLSWVFFRSESVEQAMSVIHSMIGLNDVVVSKFFANILYRFFDVPNMLLADYIGPLVIGPLAYLWVLVFGLVAFLVPNSGDLVGFVKGQKPLVSSLKLKFLYLIAMSVSIVLICSQVATEFLYFNF